MSNTITVNGALGNDAELKYTKSGNPVLEFSVGDNKQRGDGTGNWVDARPTLWWRCSLWGRQGEALAPLLTKGTRVDISGEATLREYEHNGEKRISNEVKVTMIGVSDRQQRTQQPQQQFGNSAAQPQPQFGDSAAQSAFDQYNAAAAEGGWNDAPPF